MRAPAGGDHRLDERRFLQTLQQPTLILAGDDDPLVPLINARILGALIPNARVHVYSGGHVELVADPDRLVPTIEDFLSSDDRATDVSGPGRPATWAWTSLARRTEQE